MASHCLIDVFVRRPRSGAYTDTNRWWAQQQVKSVPRRVGRGAACADRAACGSWFPRAQKNIKATGAKVKKLIAKKEFELADYVRKKIGAVGSGKDYYQSGR